MPTSETKTIRADSIRDLEILTKAYGEGGWEAFGPVFTFIEKNTHPTRFRYARQVRKSGLEPGAPKSNETGEKRSQPS